MSELETPTPGQIRQRTARAARLAKKERPTNAVRGKADLGKFLGASGLAFVEHDLTCCEPETAVAARQTRMLARGIRLLPRGLRSVGTRGQATFACLEPKRLAQLMETAASEGHLVKGRYDDADSVVWFARDADLRVWRLKDHTYLHVTGTSQDYPETPRWAPFDHGEWTAAAWPIDSAQTPGGEAGWREARSLLDDLWAIDESQDPCILVTANEGNTTLVSAASIVTFEAWSLPRLTTRVANAILSIHPTIFNTKLKGESSGAAAHLRIDLHPSSATLRAARAPRRAEATERLVEFTIHHGRYALAEEIAKRGWRN